MLLSLRLYDFNVFYIAKELEYTNQKYNTGPGRGVKNIIFRNISCIGKYINSSLIEGYDKNRKIENILFENIVLNGRRITSLEELNIDKKDFVEKIRIK